MGWERRKRGPGTGYFYRSIRSAGTVRKVYYGRGTAGHEAEIEIEQRRRGRLEAKKLIEADRSGTDEADRLAIELRQWAAVLSAAWLILTGHHKHHGLWRRNTRG